MAFTDFAFIVYFKHKQYINSCLYFTFKRTKTDFSVSSLSKAAALNLQMSKFYLQIQRTEASHHIYFSQPPVLNVTATFCV